MAQKFGNARWVKEGYFDDRMAEVVVGQITFAALGIVDFCLAGGLSGEIAGKVIQFRNPKFLDDPYAGEWLEDFAIPQIGKVSLLSFDPHPLLSRIHTLNGFLSISSIIELSLSQMMPG
jgi:hypothetical protein